MFIIADEDVGKIKAVVCEILSTVANGAKRVDKDVDVGDGLDAMIVTGYWVGDIIRTDIKVRR